MYVWHAQAGILAGPLGLLFFGVVSMYTMQLMLDCKKIALDNGFKPRGTQFVYGMTWLSFVVFVCVLRVQSRLQLHGRGAVDWLVGCCARQPQRDHVQPGRVRRLSHFHRRQHAEQFQVCHLVAVCCPLSPMGMVRQDNFPLGHFGNGDLRICAAVHFAAHIPSVVQGTSVRRLSWHGSSHWRRDCWCNICSVIVV